MKNYLFPFLLLFSIVICGQNAANKVEKYRIDPELAYPFKKPLLGKVKKSTYGSLFYGCNYVE